MKILFIQVEADLFEYSSTDFDCFIIVSRFSIWFCFFHTEIFVHFYIFQYTLINIHAQQTSMNMEYQLNFIKPWISLHGILFNHPQTIMQFYHFILSESEKQLIRKNSNCFFLFLLNRTMSFPVSVKLLFTFSNTEDQR